MRLSSRRARRSASARVAIAAASLLCFAALSVEAVRGFALPEEVEGMRMLHTNASPPLDVTMLAVSALGSGAAIGVLSALGLLRVVRAADARAGVVFAVTVAGSLLDLAFGPLFDRPRPRLWHLPHAAVFTGLAAPRGDSFPSGHAMSSAALVLALVLTLPPGRLRTALAVVGPLYVLAVGFSRVYLGVHYPSDVLGGWSLALAWAVAVAMAARRREPDGRHGRGDGLERRWGSVRR